MSGQGALTVAASTVIRGEYAYMGHQWDVTIVFLPKLCSSGDQSKIDICILNLSRWLPAWTCVCAPMTGCKTGWCTADLCGTAVLSLDSLNLQKLELCEPPSSGSSWLKSSYLLQCDNIMGFGTSLFKSINHYHRGHGVVWKEGTVVLIFMRCVFQDWEWIGSNHWNSKGS